MGWTMCVDFNDFNQACPKDSYSIPQIDQLVAATNGHTLLNSWMPFKDSIKFSCMSLTKRKLPHYKERLVLVQNDAIQHKEHQATYQNIVNWVFKAQIGRRIKVYMDNMIVKSGKKEHQVADLNKAFITLKKYNMKLHPKKCFFGVQ